MLFRSVSQSRYGTVIAQLDAQASGVEAEGEEDDTESAGPLQIAVDLNETSPSAS